MSDVVDDVYPMSTMKKDLTCCYLLFAALTNMATQNIPLTTRLRTHHDEQRVH